MEDYFDWTYDCTKIQQELTKSQDQLNPAIIGNQHVLAHLYQVRDRLDQLEVRAVALARAVRSGQPLQ